ncbi:MAG: efflux transporter outer membrane subunit [Hyphomicrobiales bacterium]|nr:efflux transporter outer membrane subunit [Hyphomicrobiales bacterium]
MPATVQLAHLRGDRRLFGVTINRLLAFGVIACGLAACSVGPDYQAPEPPMPASFIAAASSKAASSRAASSTKWWRTLHDRELDSLIDRAIAGSPTLEIALNRIQQARAQEAVIVGTALPAAEASEGGGWGTGGDLARGRASQTLVSAANSAGTTQINNIAGFDAVWEIDVFGKFRRAIEAAQYAVDAAIAARNMVLISLVADVTRAYLDLRALQMQLAVLRKNIEVAQKYVDFVQQRYSRGITNELDVTLAQRELAQLQAQVAPLIARGDAARYVIAVLLGEFPENLNRELARPGVLPALPARIRSGMPIDLLRRRPDIVEAERQLAGATALIGVATANLFPQVAVSAGIGQQQGPGLMAAPINPIWSVGPALAAPVLDFGRLDAFVEKADFRSRELLFNYKQTVLNAVREVDTAVDAYAAQQDRLRHLGDALTAARRAVTLATERFDRGLTDSLNVIDAQRQEFEIEQQYVFAQQSAAEQLVTLYKSLGSGWEDYQAFPPIPPPLPALAAAFKSLIAAHPAP